MSWCFDSTLHGWPAVGNWQSGASKQVTIFTTPGTFMASERTVSCVERTHGRDESDAGPVPAAECPAQFLAVCDCFHFLGLKS